MKPLKAFFALVLIISTSPVLAKSSSEAYSFQKRAEMRTSQRWTLQEWLERKDRMAMMDLWLNLNSPSPYEFMIGGSYNSFKTTDNSTPPKDESFISYEGKVAAYANLIGVSAEYENNTQESYHNLAGLFNLRIFGNSIQSTAITLSYGLRTKQAADNLYRLSQQLAQAHLQLYLTKNFGIEGVYRHFFSFTEDHFGETNTKLTEGGAFIEFSGVRIFGTWFQEKDTHLKNSVETKGQREGIKSGVKFFF